VVSVVGQVTEDVLQIWKLQKMSSYFVVLW